MLNEINAALDHLVTLLHPSIDCKGFKQQASRSLTTRYANTWFPNDPNRASASRVIHWHGHGGGEGQDEGLYKACISNMTPKQQDVDLFSSPFTLWIDPICVSIRMGHGPGVYLSPASSLNIRIIYGHPAVEHQLPLTLPTVNLVPSTPALSSSENIAAWSSLQNKRIPQTMPPFHNRSFSDCSNSSTFTTTRSASNGSSSYLSSADESEQCPSLTNTSARDSDSEISVEDLIDNGCYMDFDLIDDEEEDALHGDETIGNDDNDGDVTISPNHEDATNTPVSIVNYDGGNVGVLGGGIRLGGASKPTTMKMTRSPLALNADAASYDATVWQKSALPTYNVDASLEFSMSNNSPFMLMDGNKRIRSRGRRSRGRGAGRAARRQAAAIQAMSTTGLDQQFSSVMSMSERFEDSGEDENIMNIVRQRADQISREVARRQYDQEYLKSLHKIQAQQHHQAVYPPLHIRQQSYNSMQAPGLKAPHQYLPIMQHTIPSQHQAFAYSN